MIVRTSWKPRAEVVREVSDGIRSRACSAQMGSRPSGSRAAAARWRWGSLVVRSMLVATTNYKGKAWPSPAGPEVGTSRGENVSWLNL